MKERHCPFPDPATWSSHQRPGQDKSRPSEVRIPARPRSRRRSSSPRIKTWLEISISASIIMTSDNHFRRFCHKISHDFIMTFVTMTIQRGIAKLIKHSPGAQVARVQTCTPPKFIVLLSSRIPLPCALSLTHNAFHHNLQCEYLS